MTKGDQSWQVNAIPARKAPSESPLGGTLPTRDTPLLPMESLSLYLPIHLISIGIDGAGHKQTSQGLSQGRQPVRTCPEQ